MNSLSRLIDDVICELVFFKIRLPDIRVDKCYKISLTEEIVNNINRAIKLKQQNMDMDEISFHLKRKVNYSELMEFAGYAWEDEYIASSNFVDGIWEDKALDNGIDTIRVSFDNSEGKSVIQLSIGFSEGLNGFCFIDADPDVSSAKTLREVLVPFGVNMEKVSYE